MTRTATGMPPAYETAPLPWCAMSSSQPSHPDPREILRRLSRDPTVDPAAPESTADQFCRLACLVYSEVDHPDRWAKARDVLAEHPEIVAASIAAAAGAADSDALAAHLAADPDAARRENGPHRWAPLLYLTYSRAVGGDEPADRFLRCARLLLDAGADPDAGFLWRGLPTPFTALTGVFGEGEQGAGKQPRHPHSPELARLLLSAGANPNDGQGLYNRMFRPENSHLLLLFEFGLGRVDGGRWADMLVGFTETTTQMLARQLGWAIDHGFGERVELLMANGVDIISSLADGRTPAEHAGHAGYREIVDGLSAAGATVSETFEGARLLGALLAGDAAGAAKNSDRLPDLLVSQPTLVHRARTARAVALIGESGFAVDAREGGRTALHEAALAGDLELITALLAVGADPNAIDDQHHTPPLGWAGYACQSAAVGLLEPVTGR